MSGEPDPPQDDDDGRTVFSPGSLLPGNESSATPTPGTGDWGAAAVPPPPSSDPGNDPADPARPATIFPTAATPRQVEPGDILNHLYQVRRSIARGGMGEVFEGVNINQDDERVAIKVILPHLAADPNVLAMFRKEARTLTRLAHPALVQYRTLAQEPQLGVFYIVTEFIEGQNLSDVLRTIEATEDELLELMRRLAGGLAAAHSLGAIHRDISPDNVMLAEGRLAHAKIIDFGIAKDLDASSQTIVGDGFAGKLNYVAPEQLGDFDRTVGPWTDVYSLALTILSVVRRRDVDMGATLVDAVDKRRAGPDLSDVPPRLREVMTEMLRPNPADRLRSMGDVIARIDQIRAGPAITHQETVFQPRTATTTAAPAAGHAGTPGGMSARLAAVGPRAYYYAGGALAAVLVLAAAIYALSGGGGAPKPAASESGGAPAVAAPADPLAAAQAALTTGLPQVPCAWLDIADVSANGSEIAASFKGVAGNPAEAQSKISALLSGAGLRASGIDFDSVSPINPASCEAIAAFRAIRAQGASHIATARTKYEMDVLPPESSQPGKLGAEVVIEIDLNNLPDDVALIGLQDDGTMARFVSSRSEIKDNGEQIRPDVYRISADITHPGWSGIVLVSGKGPFDFGLPNSDPVPMPAGWAQGFLTQAKAKGWHAEMLWYKLVDDVPNRSS
jgi:hypothetical protein